MLGNFSAPQSPKSPSRRRLISGMAAAVLLVGNSWSLAQTGATKRRATVLLVSTNVDTVGTNASGTYLMEIAYPFQYFSDQGFDVRVVTPKGGKAAIYHGGKMEDALARIQASPAFVSATANTLSSTEVVAGDYVAIFYPGGHGQFWDVVKDSRIAAAAAAIYENGGVIGAAGHGTAGLVDVKLSNGKYLVEGKRMTCFPTWAEKAWMNISDFGKLLPFDMQEVLVQRKADLVLSTKETVEDKRLTLVADDANRLVTGSFARSAGAVAQEMHRLLKAGKTQQPA